MRVFLLFTLFIMACSTTPHSVPSMENPYPPQRPPVIGDIFHVPTGYYVTEAQMLEVLSSARVVYVGETHDNPASHRLQLRVLRAMVERYPGKVAIGMEMFNPKQQAQLDAWVEGGLSEAEFLEQSGWSAVWSMDFGYYRDLLLFAQQHRVPVLGLNAEREVVRALSRGGELPEGTQLPEMNLDDPYQRTMVAAIFAGHTHGGGNIDAFVRIQTLWDETMAENIANYLQKRADMRMVIFAGGNHIRHGFGIPRRVFRRLPVSYQMVGNQELDIPPDKLDRLMDVEMPDFPLLPYDFVVYTEYEDL